MTVTETGTPGTFTGTVATLYDPDPAAPRASNDGTFPVRNGTVLTGRPMTTRCGRMAGRPPSPTTPPSRAETTGTVTISATVPGDDATVTVIDADLIGAPDFTLTITGPGAETETVTVTETGTPGTFTGAVPTAFDPDPAAPRARRTTASSPIRNGDVLAIAYGDALTATGGTQTRTDDTTVGGGHVGHRHHRRHRAGRAPPPSPSSTPTWRAAPTSPSPSPAQAARPRASPSRRRAILAPSPAPSPPPSIPCRTIPARPVTARSRCTRATC